MTRTQKLGRPQRSHGRAALCVLCYLCVLGFASDTRAQEPSAPQCVSPAQLQAAIAKLGDLDYATRTSASRTVRRTASAQAVPALMQAVSEQADGYVRYRALILLTGFNDLRTKDAMRESLASPNDRLRTVAYSFFEHNPDRAMLPSFMTALEKEQAEFVRPALVRALASVAATGQGDDITRARQALVREVSRGEDFFRSAVIEALGDYKAQYAVEALLGRRQARRAAAGRCGAGAGQDRRQARARHARRDSAQRAANRAAGDCHRDLSSRRQLRVASELSRRHAANSRTRTRVSRSCCAAPPPALARSPSPVTPTPRKR